MHKDAKWPNRKKDKGHPRVIIWIKKVDLESPMLYTKIQPQSFFGSGEENIFKCFCHVSAILLNGPWPFLQMFRGDNSNNYLPPSEKGTNLKKDFSPIGSKYIP